MVDSMIDGVNMHAHLQESVMNALFYVTHYHHEDNCWDRFLITVPDGSHDCRQAVIDYYRAEYGGKYGRVHAQYICLTAETVWQSV